MYETDKVEAQYRANILNVGAYAKNICILNRKGSFALNAIS